jgi:hypothetical protein
MRTGSGPVRSCLRAALTRGLLLLLVVIGVIAMHTLGHAEHVERAAGGLIASHATAVLGNGLHAFAAAHEDRAVAHPPECPDNCPGHEGPVPGSGTDLTSICLAVLCASMIVLVVRLLNSGRARPALALAAAQGGLLAGASFALRRSARPGLMVLRI